MNFVIVRLICFVWGCLNFIVNMKNLVGWGDVMYFRLDLVGVL